MSFKKNSDIIKKSQYYLQLNLVVDLSLQIKIANMFPKVGNIERLQKALQAVEMLSPQQISLLSKQQNLHELRLARLKNAEYERNENSTRQDEIEQEGSHRNNTYNENINRGVRWQILQQAPNLSYKQPQHSYENQFNKIIDQLRKNTQKQQQFKFDDKQEINKQQSPQHKSMGIFSAVFSNQTGPSTMTQSKDNNVGKTQQTNNDAQTTNRLSFFNTSNKTNKSQQKLFTEQFYISQEKSKMHLSNLENNKQFMVHCSEQKIMEDNKIESEVNLKTDQCSVFTKKFQVQQTPKPIVQFGGNGELFGKDNSFGDLPLNNKQNFSLFTNNNITQLQKPNNSMKDVPSNVDLLDKAQQNKTTIFQNSLFSHQNSPTPNTMNQQFNINVTKSSSVKRMDQVQQPKRIIKTESESIDSKIKQQNKKQEEQQSIADNYSIVSNAGSIFEKSNSIFDHTPLPNIFETPNINKFGEQNTNLQIIKNLPLFPNGNLVAPSLFNFGTNSNEQLQSKPTLFKKGQSYQGGSLFSNNLTQNQQKKQVIPTKIDEKKEQTKKSNSIFGSLNQQAKKTSPDKKTNTIFTNLPSPFFTSFNQNSVFGSKNPSTGNSIFGKITNPQTNNLTFGQNDIFQKQKKQNSQIIDLQQKEGDMNKKKPNQIFDKFVKSKQGDIFSKDPQNSNNGLNIGGSITGSLFGSLPTNKNSIFTFSKGLFDNEGPKAAEQKNEKDEDEDEGQEEDENGVYEDKAEIDPTKSTGNYKYEESSVLYREAVSKFKKGNQNMLENVIISIEKVGSNQSYTLYVRLANKTIHFVGTIFPGVTEITKIKENQYRNISIKKIVYIKKDDTKALQLLKIQFKEDKQGQLFFEKVSKICQKTNP